MEALKLIGVLIVIVGFVLKFDTLAVVVVAGLATGLVAGMSPLDILNTLGTAFINNRTATLFVLTLPVIGICERMGLKDKAVDLIKSLKAATTGSPGLHLPGHPDCGLGLLHADRRPSPVCPPPDQPHGPGRRRGPVWCH